MEDLDRRSLIAAVGVAAAAGLAACERRDAAGEGADAPAGERPPIRPAELGTEDADWAAVREAFDLNPNRIHMSAMLIASHPRPVREAIERHRRELDADPVVYLNANNRRLQTEARGAAGRFMGTGADAVALTDSTTMGVGLIYNGLRLRPGQEILTTAQDYFVTVESARQASLRTGATVREIELYRRIETVSADEIVDRLTAAIRPNTRVLGLTWVHSSTGLKLPMPAVAEAVGRINAGRGRDDRVMIVLDGVHGFGVEDTSFAELGCDFFAAGCHKWLFGPRGTGVLMARPDAWPLLVPAIPSFLDDGTFQAWIADGSPGPNDAERMTPGGFKAFEHRWALVDAFRWRAELGQANVQARTHALASQLKAGLADIRGVLLRTPRDPALSSGIVSFDVSGREPNAVVGRLRSRGVIASVAPYATPHVRLTPSVRNTSAEIDAALDEVRALV